MDDEIMRYKERLESQKSDLPIWEKKCLTIFEASEYFGIGITLLRKMTSIKNCPYIVSASNQVFISRERFEDYLRKRRRI